MTYKIYLSEKANEYFQKQDKKSQRIIRRNLKKLEKEPYPSPSSRKGDKEKIVLKGISGFRLHISRAYTAFYQIRENQKQIMVIELMTIDQAHKKYGKLK